MARRAPEVSFERWPYPSLIAHRGAGTLAPENTLAALREGAARGFAMFEFDAKLSLEGTAVLMHDDALDRTTDASGLVARRSLAELARLDAGAWHSPAFAGERIPTLAQACEWLRARRLMANVEIKPCPGREAETGAAVAREALEGWRGEAVPPLLSSFSEAALRAARDAAPELPRALLFERLPEDWAARCGALGCVAVVVHHGCASAALASSARRARLRLLVYGVEDAPRARALLAAGVDGVITDAVGEGAAL